MHLYRRSITQGMMDPRWWRDVHDEWFQGYRSTSQLLNLLWPLPNSNSVALVCQKMRNCRSSKSNHVIDNFRKYISGKSCICCAKSTMEPAVMVTAICISRPNAYMHNTVGCRSFWHSWMIFTTWPYLRCPVHNKFLWRSFFIAFLGPWPIFTASKHSTNKWRRPKAAEFQGLSNTVIINCVRQFLAKIGAVKVMSFGTFCDPARVILRVNE